jgi:phosphoglycolate phosphatase-like HAD superfamily hydrolase
MTPDLPGRRTAILGSGAFHASKPDPDILLAALKKIAGRPEQAIMLGDALYDVEAARGAHVRCVAVRCGGWDDHSLHGAVSIVDDPVDVLVHFEQAFGAP